MNDRNLDQLLTAWLERGPSSAPDRVADAARLESRRTRQTAVPLWWRTRRFPLMNNTAKFGLAAAAVVVAALLGYTYLIAPNVGGPSLGDPTPTSTPTVAPVSFTEHEGGGAELEPGPYLIDYAAPVRVTITVPDQPFEQWPSPWYKAMFDWGPWHQTDRAALGFGDIANVLAEPCAAGTLDPVPGPTVADLVDAIVAVPGVQVQRRTDVTLDGYAGVLLDLEVNVPDDCPDEPIMLETSRGDPLPLPGPGDRLRFWILDIEGTRLSVWAIERLGVFQGDPLQSLIDTIQIEAP